MDSYSILRMGRSGRWLIQTLVVVLLIAVAGVSIRAENRATVRIDTLRGAQFGSSYNLGVNLENVAPGTPMVGFNLLINFDGSVMQVDSVLIGTALVSCAWEYFSYRLSADDYCPYPPCPEQLVGLLRIVALADINNGTPYPTCFLENSGELARLRITTSSDPGLLCNLAPIRFYWKDCGDNALAVYPSGDTVLISDKVFDLGGQWRIDDPNMGLPGGYGAPNECLVGDTLSGHAAIRGIDYYNGFVEFVCEDTATDHVTVTLGRVRDASVGHPVELPVHLYKHSSSAEFGGFDLRLTYDPTALSFTGATVGTLLQDCGWEYFSYSSGVDSSCAGSPCPIPFIRLVALAETNNGDIHPSCWFDTSGTLAQLHFIVFPNDTLVCHKMPLAFYWNDCTDNLFSDPSGDTTSLSRRVYNEWGFPITRDTSFPTHFGASSACLSGGGTAVTRAIDFVDGSVMVACHEGIDSRGDINLNGIAYEIADWVLFTNYLLGGDSVFQFNPAGQLATSDINADGLPGTMFDYIYLYRIIRGLAVPWTDSTTLGSGVVTVTQYAGSKTIMLTGVDSLAGLHLVFRGNIAPHFPQDSAYLLRYSQFDGAFTRVLIAPQLSYPGTTPLFGTGVVLTYDGDGVLEEASCADYSNTYYTVVMFTDTISALAEIRIGEVAGVYRGSRVSIPITLTTASPDIQFGGFDLLIAYDTSVVTVIDVTAGQLLTGCQWEYFTHRTGPSILCDSFSCSELTLHIVALADINNGGYHPTCYGDTLGELANLSLRVSTSRLVPCRQTHLRFVWNECSDNAFSTTGGDTLLVSQNVYSHTYGNITGDDSFPTPFGAPSSCLTASVLRGINFRNGWVDVFCGDSIDNRGDINLNGLANEIADVVVFTNYFLNGPAALSIIPQAQVQATDVNADGHYLSVADLEYLWRIIVGDAAPFPRPADDSGAVATFVQDTVARTISLNYVHSLGAIHLMFDGQIDPVDTMIGGLVIGSAVDSGITRVLLSPSVTSDSPWVNLDHVGAGLLFHYTGNGQLMFADATFDGTQITPTAIEGSSGICCLHRGNIEGWNDPFGMIDIADLTLLVDYVFGSPVPAELGCIGEADASGDNSIDITDITALVEYLFAGVPLPLCH